MATTTTATASASRTWGFQILLVASGASELETTASNSAVQLIAAESQLASWSRTVSYRVITRVNVETQARAMKREELAAAARASAETGVAAATVHVNESSNGHIGSTSDNSERMNADDGQELAEAPALSASASNASVHMSPSPSTAELIAGMKMAPQILANALQRLVRDDKTAFLAHAATHHDVATAATSVTMSDSSSLAAFAVDHESLPQGEGAVPARIYLLHAYPSSLAEMLALLHTGEAGSAQQHSLPLLPLIDGVVLVVDPSRAVREGRRKSIEHTDERRKSISQRHIAAAAATATASTGSAALDSPNDDDSIRAASAVASVFETANNDLVRTCVNAQRTGGLAWSDFVVADVACLATTVRDAKGFSELAQSLLQTAAMLAAHKYEFKQWVATTTMLPLASFDAAKPAARAMVELYSSIVDSVYEASVSVSTVLCAIREAVALAAGDVDSSDATLSTSLDSGGCRSNQSDVDEFITHSDNAARRLAVAYTTFVREQTATQSLEPSGSHLSRRVADPCSVLGRRIDAVEKDMWANSDLPGVGNNGRKGLPIQPTLSHTMRSVQDTELRAFAPIDVARVHITRQLQQFEDLLGATWRHKLQPTRQFAQALDATVLPQRLAHILADFPAVHTRYDAPTDSLLLAALAATAPGRLRTTNWNARSHVRHRPAFKDWQRERRVPDVYLTPRTREALDAIVPLSSAELAQVGEKTSVLFPSDQSVIRVYETPRGDAWLSVYQRGNVFGFRQRNALHCVQTAAAAEPLASPTPSERLEFVAAFADASRLHIREGRAQLHKPDGFATVAVDCTFANGLTITANSDGSIVQRYVSATHRAESSTASDSNDIEVFRLIVGSGTVVRAFASGARTVLLANGDVYHYGDPATAVDDEARHTGPAHRVVDPATNALVDVRATGAVVITHTDGARATYHTDGTCMFTTRGSAQSQSSHVLVTAPGFADVCIDVAVDAAATRHARGKRVVVAKRGLRTRCTVGAFDGTRITVAYNTKVVAQVNGRVTVETPSGVRVVAKDSGRVEYDPRGVTPSAEDADLDATSDRGVYYFDCKRGRFALCDDAQNAFRVDFGCCDGDDASESRQLRSPKVVVDLAGVVSDAEAATYDVAPIRAHAVVTDPIEPHLLVLRGDGTGVELLRPSDAESAGRASADSTSRQRDVTTYDQQPMRVILETLATAPSRDALLFADDPVLAAAMARLAQPVSAAAAYLAHVYWTAQPPQPQFTVVRRLERLDPLSATELADLEAALVQWRAWQTARDATMAQYCVEDPRSIDEIAQQNAVTNKVVAAYKAARARKRLERQRARDAARKLELSRHSSSGAAAVKMATVQEQPHDGDGGDDDGDSDDSDAIGDSSGDDSDASGGGDDARSDVDDPDELLWTAFAAADATGAGRLSIAQTRHALVHAIGVGVQMAELLAALARLQLHDTNQVGFDAFAALADELKRCSDRDNNTSSPSNSVPPVPKLTGLHVGVTPSTATQQQSALVAAGSATEAIRLKAARGAAAYARE